MLLGALVSPIWGSHHLSEGAQATPQPNLDLFHPRLTPRKDRCLMLSEVTHEIKVKLAWELIITRAQPTRRQIFQVLAAGDGQTCISTMNQVLFVGLPMKTKLRGGEGVHRLGEYNLRGPWG